MSSLNDVVKNYVSGKHPTSFGGRTETIKAYPEFPKDEILNKLFSVHSYTSHREAKRPKIFNPVFVRAKRKLLQSDLLELNADIWESNNGIRYILMIQDTFTRKLFTRPLINKKEQTVTPLFEEIINEMKPLHFKCLLLTDKGREFDNNNFKKMLKENKITLIHPSAGHHAPHIERANLSLQRLIYRYIEESGNSKFIHRLEDLVNVFNTRYHRIIKMSAEEAELEENKGKIIKNQQKYYDKAYKKGRKQSFMKIGDKVKILKTRTKFRRGYDRNFTNEVYIIKKIHKHLPVAIYEIESYDGVPIDGKFYHNELQLKTGNVFKVEKVVKTRIRRGKTEYLVKWLGYPDSANSWIKNKPR